MTFQFDVESGIAKSVRLLRLHGFETKFSCEGHGQIKNPSNPYICFTKQELPEKFELILNINGWKIDREFEEINDDNLMRICAKGLPDREYENEEEWKKFIRNITKKLMKNYSKRY